MPSAAKTDARTNDMTEEQYDVAIVGAGPAGATAAILLAKKNRRVALIDRADFPREVTCAGWLNARSATLLETLPVEARPSATGSSA